MACSLFIFLFFFSPIYVAFLEITGWQLLRRIDVGMKNKRVGILWSWQGDWDFTWFMNRVSFQELLVKVVPERYRIIVTYVLIFFPFVLGFVEIWLSSIFLSDRLSKKMEEIINKFINNTINLINYCFLSFFIIYNFQIISFFNIIHNLNFSNFEKGSLQKFIINFVLKMK